MDQKTKRLQLLCCLITLTVGCLASSASAAVITDLYNTGVDNLGNALPNLSVDPHYTVLSPGQPAIVPNLIPTSWVPDNANSRWIVPQNMPGGIGPFTYQTTFTLPASADLSSVVITGLWGTDNPGTDMRINGGSTGLTNTIQFTALTPFTLDSSNSTFVTGTNVLEIDLTNINGPTGLRIDQIRGIYVPEPTSGLTLGSLMMWAWWRRRR